ncbi:MAG TPA: hypothetical protein VJO15_05875 [Dehalococcoidia bacterium]|nr:hypothetical protein [Dehalococcoidia bacterium]
MSDRIRVSLTPPTVEAEAGGRPVEVTVAVQNSGPVVDQYTLELEGLDPQWYSLPVSSVSLFPQDSSQITLSLHPPRRSATRAGGYPYVVRARSRADPTQETAITGTLVIAAYAIFQMDMSPKRVTGRKGAYRLALVNGGNSDLTLELTARDPERACVYNLSPGRPVVPPGTRIMVPLTVRPRRGGLIGEPRTYDFTVTAQPSGDADSARTIAGQLVHTPRFRTWKPFLLLALLLLLGAAVAAAAVAVSRAGGLAEACQKAEERIKELVELDLPCPSTSTPGAGLEGATLEEPYLLLHNRALHQPSAEIVGSISSSGSQTGFGNRPI